VRSPQREKLLSQLDVVLEEIQDVESIENASTSDYQRATTRALAAISRVAGESTAYYAQALRWVDMRVGDKFLVEKLYGIVGSLKSDIEQGHLESLESLVHAELFTDFLEMADHLIENGYKDPAAVIAGSTLEEGLRQLCNRHSIEVEIETKSGMRPKKADQMNSDLAREGVYSKLDHKNVTAWLELRNDAAHGRYDQYNIEQVDSMISGVREFLSRNQR